MPVFIVWDNVLVAELWAQGPLSISIMHYEFDGGALSCENQDWTRQKLSKDVALCFLYSSGGIFCQMVKVSIHNHQRFGGTFYLRGFNELRRLARLLSLLGCLDAANFGLFSLRIFQ